jgi:hypothetical protein
VAYEEILMPVFQIRLRQSPDEPGNLEELANELWLDLSGICDFYNETICDELKHAAPVPRTKWLGNDARILYEFDASHKNPEALCAAMRLLFSAHLDRFIGVIGRFSWLTIEPTDDVPQTLENVLADFSEDEGLLERIRPAESLAESFQGILDNAQPEVIHSLAWYMAAMAHPPFKLVERLVDACLSVRTPEVAAITGKMLRLLAPRVDLGALMDKHLPSNDPLAVALALELLDQAVVRERLNANWRIGALLDALRLGDEAAEVAATKLGHTIDKNNLEHLPRVSRALTIFLASKPSQEGRHNAVLSLVNLYFGSSEVPPENVLTVLKTEADTAPSPIAELAQWALKVFC